MSALVTKQSTSPTSGEVNHRVSVAVVEGIQRRRVGLDA